MPNTRAPAVPPGTVWQLLEQINILHSAGMMLKDVGPKLGITYNSVSALRIMQLALTDPNPRVAEAARRGLDRINLTGRVDHSYRELSALRKGERVRPPSNRPRQHVGKTANTISSSFTALRGLTIGFNDATVNELSNIDIETLQEWAAEAKRFRAVLFGFIKRAEEASK